MYDSNFMHRLHCRGIERKISNEQSELIRLHNQNNRIDLSTKDWYWSTISRGQANDLLHGMKDGTFLVRNSTNNVNDYTLTVKKDGINKMMRILCINGKYGFCAPARFDSLESLIEYHTQHSLAEYCPEMNVRLEHSLSKANICSNLSVNWDQFDVKLLNEKLMVANQVFLELNQEYDDYHRDYKNCQDEIQKFKQNLNCFEETFAIFDEQLKLNEENQKSAMECEKDDMAKHHEEIKNKLEEIKEFKKQIERRKEEKINESIILDQKINNLKPLVNEKKRYREQIKAILINKIGHEGVDKILDQQSNCTYSNETPFVKQLHLDQLNQKNHDNYDQIMKLNYCQIDKEFLSNTCSPTNESNFKVESTNIFDHANEKNESLTYLNFNCFKSDQSNFDSIIADWYVGDMSKEQVNIVMKNQPEGTFLVRDSKNRIEAPYTLTVRVNGCTKMLRILRSENGLYYGFNPNRLEFRSVEKLISHYLNEPLIVFNSNLIIRLVNPLSKSQIQSQ